MIKRIRLEVDQEHPGIAKSFEGEVLGCPSGLVSGDSFNDVSEKRIVHAYIAEVEVAVQCGRWLLGDEEQRDAPRLPPSGCRRTVSRGVSTGDSVLVLSHNERLSIGLSADVTLGEVLEDGGRDQ